jgi:hypothetical protein
VFAPFKEIFFENSSYIEEVAEIYKDADLDEYSAAIKKYKAQSSEFTEIPYQADVGIIRANSEGLKKRLMPSPVLCLNALKDLLPQLIKRDNDKVRVSKKAVLLCTSYAYYSGVLYLPFRPE